MMRVAIIGQGRSGRDIHGKFFRSDANDFCKVVCIVEEDGFRADRARREFGCDVVSHYTELFGRQDIDLVVNASYSQMHYAITRDLLCHGFNVLCEKPFGRTYFECQDLINTAKANGVIVAAFHQTLFAPAFLKAKEIIASGCIGDVFQISLRYSGFARRWDWQTSQAYAGGGVRNTGPHPLDQAIQFFGDADPEEIFCKMDRANTFGDAEDHIKLIFSGKGHPTIDLEVSRCCAFPGNTYEIYGTCGGLKAVNNEVSWKYFCPKDMPEQKPLIEPLRGEGEMPVYCSEEMHIFEEKWTCPAYATGFDYMGADYYKDIYEALTTGKPTEVQLAQVKRQIRIIEECHRQNPIPKTIDIGNIF